MSEGANTENRQRSDLNRVRALIYNQDGRILKDIRTVESAVPENVEEGGGFIVVEEDDPVDVETHWINADRQVVAKSEYDRLVVPNDATIEAPITISGIPEGTTVTWPDYVQTLEYDGIVELTVSAGGEYRFLFENPRFVDKEVVVDV